jgi:hypothetical protein
MVNGAPQPAELVYSQRLWDWVIRLDPQASEPLRIAARGQHVQRWTIPRSHYPMTRAGYLKWREVLKGFHADTVAGAMRQAGYPDELIGRVKRLISKRDLATDPETQTLEDALCLLFLETQFADLRSKTPQDKMAEVVRKTWAKMSKQARKLALELPLAAGDRAFLERILADA